MTTPKDSPTHETMNPLKPSPELVSQWWEEARSQWEIKPHEYIATKAAEWGAQQVRNSMQFQAAIAAAKEKGE